MARRSNGMRNLQSAGRSAARFTGGATEKAAVGLFRWAATDHSGMSKALSNMPSMGLIESAKYILWRFLRHRKSHSEMFSAAGHGECGECGESDILFLASSFF